jgi:HEAT repeat protein
MLLAQADPSKLIEQLRSEQADLRREARRKLKELGPAARPDLQKATKDGDPDVAAAARELLRVLSVSERLSPRLKESLPGIEEKLAVGPDRAWTEAFLEATAEQDGKAMHAGLRPEDLEPLAASALKGVASDSAQLKHAVMSRVAALQLRSGASAMASLLQDPEDNVQEMAAFFLGYLGSKEPAADLRRMLGGTNFGAAKRSADALGQLRATEAAPDLVKLLEDQRPDLRKAAVKSLAKLGAKESAPSILKLLDDPQVAVRIAAASCLCEFGRSEGVPTILKECGDPRLDWEESPALTFLNALRRPEAWRKLSGKSLAWGLTGDWGLEGPRGKILERIASTAGLALELPPDAPWAREEDQVQKWCGPTTLPQDLLLMLSSTGFDAIVESDRIRLVPHAEALKLWQQWWQEKK